MRASCEAGVSMNQFQSVPRPFAPVERLPLVPEEWTGWRDAIFITAKRLAVRALGLTLISVALGTIFAFATQSQSDPSWNNASAAAAQNALGLWGANIADVLSQSIGIAGWIIAVPPLLWGIWLVDGRVGLRLPWRILAWTISCLLYTSPSPRD